MSDIFISYASADRERAKLMSEVLVERGWSVWWDRAIPPGRQFDEVIEEALDAAKCVVVLWSQASVASTWVKTEAAEATRAKALIPALIEDVKIPLEFRRLHAADLSRWQGDRSDQQLLNFFQSIEAALKRSGEERVSSGTENAAGGIAPEKRGEPPPPAPAPVVKREEPAPKRKLSPAVIGGIVAVVVALLGAVIYYERSTSIAAAEKAAVDKAAQATADREREESARKADEARIAKSETPGKRSAPARTQQGVPASGVMNVRWRDHALSFGGSLSWSPSSAMLRADVTDLKTGARIGSYNVPALISQQGATEYIVSADFAVPGDSATPGPHTHTSRLRVRAEQDGSLRFLQNCPRPGECY